MLGGGEQPPSPLSQQPEEQPEGQEEQPEEGLEGDGGQRDLHPETREMSTDVPSPWVNNNGASSPSNRSPGNRSPSNRSPSNRSAMGPVSPIDQRLGPESPSHRTVTWQQVGSEGEVVLVFSNQSVGSIPEGTEERATFVAQVRGLLEQ
jgi:hypothetical protein